MSLCSDFAEDNLFMLEALKEAEKAAEEDEVPVGAVLVSDGKIVARAHNRRENEKNALRHAEIIVIEEGCGLKKTWRLSDCTLYVTLEPCPMCAGAIINSRICKVVYGAKDAKAGAFGSAVNLATYNFNHKPTVTGGVLGDRSAELLRTFFARKRK